MEVKDVLTLLISATALIMSGISLWKSFRQDRRAEELKKPAIDYVLPPFEGVGAYEATFSVRNRGEAPLRLDAIVGSDEWPVILSARNSVRVRVLDASQPEAGPMVWRVPVGAEIEPGEKFAGQVWVEARYPNERLGAYSTELTFEISFRDREERAERFPIRRMAKA